MEHQALIEALQKVTVSVPATTEEGKAQDDVQVSPPLLVQDGRILVNGEHENGYLFIDYYGEFRGGYPWVCPELEAFAKKHDAYWEWEHPGAVALAL